MNHTTALKELATKLLDDYRAGSSFFLLHRIVQYLPKEHLQR